MKILIYLVVREKIMFDNVFNNLEWKKIVSKEFISFKNYRQLIREKLIKAI